MAKYQNSYQENKNRKYRPQMEDTHCTVDKIGGDPTCGLFAIFDGHGGARCANFLS